MERMSMCNKFVGCELFVFRWLKGKSKGSLFNFSSTVTSDWQTWYRLWAHVLSPFPLSLSLFLHECSVLTQLVEETG